MIQHLLKRSRLASPVEKITFRSSINSPRKNGSFRRPKVIRSLSTQPMNETNQKILTLPPQFLRAMDASEFDPLTFQRVNIRCNSMNGKPLSSQVATSCHKISSCSFDPATAFYEIVWEDGLVSHYSYQWVESELSQWLGEETKSNSKCLWTGLTEQQVRTTDLSLSFRDSVLTEDGMRFALKALYEYGIVLVTNTPTDDGGAGVAALAAALGGGSVKEGNPTSLVSHYRGNCKSLSMPILLPHGTDGPLRTLYGTVWSTAPSLQANGASVADSAYSQDGLPLHTDMTYQQDPPGLQILTMVQPATKGGESVFVDGFAVAEHLRRINRKAFATLCNTVRRYRCIDPATGWHLEARGPVIAVRNGQVVGIRHNDLDRLPDLPPNSNQNPLQQSEEDFYVCLNEAHSAWDELLAMDKFRLVMPLQRGDTMVVANQRCFHGRYSFETTAGTPRAVIGCYMSQDELNSRFRKEGFVVA